VYRAINRNLDSVEARLWRVRIACPSADRDPYITRNDPGQSTCVMYLGRADARRLAMTTHSYQTYFFGERSFLQLELRAALLESVYPSRSYTQLNRLGDHFCRVRGETTGVSATYFIFLV